MQTEIRHKPSFAAVFCTLAPGETIFAETDAMASMSGHIRLRTHLFGGLVHALLRRLFGGESLFINAFNCPGDGRPGELVLSQPVPGDIQEVPLRGTILYVQPGAFIACTQGITLGVGWAGFASWFGGDGLFRLKVSGQGSVWIGAYGGIFSRKVAGEYIVDTGHLLAYEPTISIGVALSAGIFSSFFSGEGFVSKLRGEGQVYLQSRSISGLAAWTNAHLG